MTNAICYGNCLVSNRGFIFVTMGLFRLPKTIRWIFSSAIMLITLLAAYRFSIYQLFPNLFGTLKTGAANAFWYGLRFDGRLVGTITLLLFLASFYPGKHFFKSEEGRKVALWVLGFLLTGTLAFYVLDIAYLRNFNERLNGSLISDLAKNTEKGMLYKNRTEWFAIVPGTVVIIVLCVYGWRKMHGVINDMKGTANFGKRLGWQVVLVLLCCVCIYGSFSLHPLTKRTAAQKLTPAQLTLALNPFESFFSTLPGKDQ